MKGVMSLNIYQKLKLGQLDITSILHVVGASGESLVQEVEQDVKSTLMVETSSKHSLYVNISNDQ